MKMTITWPAVAISILAISGCAQQPAGPPPTISPAPVCSSAAQCDAMWSEALVQIQNISGMRIQTATDSFVQTFNPINYGRMGAMARKVPKPDGTTTIEAQFTCTYCGNLPYDSLNLFIANVNAAGTPFAGKAQASSKSQEASTPEAKSKERQVYELQQRNLPYEQYQQEYRRIMGQGEQQ